MRGPRRRSPSSATTSARRAPTPSSPRCTPPSRRGQARDDYAVLGDLAGALGVADTYTEGRTADQWLRHLYEDWRAGDATGRRRGRGLVAGDLVRVHNDRGACLGDLVVDADLSPGVVQMSTGTCFSPVPGVESVPCAAGNVNVLTRDVGWSRQSQGCTGSRAVAETEVWCGDQPAIAAFAPPEIVDGG